MGENAPCVCLGECSLAQIARCCYLGVFAYWLPSLVGTHILINQFKCRVNTVQDDESSGRGNGP